MTNLPRIWQNGATGRRVNVLKQSLTLTDTPPSTAQLTLPPEESLNVLDYLELFSPYESAGIFRVASVSRDYMTGQQTVYCERLECVLGDTLVPGASTSFSGTIAAALTQLLGYQHTAMWTAGTVEANANVYLDIGEKSILSDIMSMMGSAPDYYVEFDQSVTPWQVNIRQKSNVVTSEGRLSRNIVSCNIQFDTADMCTRVLNDKLDGGHIDSARIGDYNTIFEQTIVLDQNATAAQNLLVAQSYMANRDRPIISIDITARNLYKITGVSIDNFKLRQLFRLALPDYGITENQRIIEMSWRDVFAEPESVSLKLANRKPDLVIDVARANSYSGGGGGGGSGSGRKGLEKAEGDFRTRIAQTDRYIALTAEQISTEMNAAITVQADRITNLVTWKETADQTISQHSASLIIMADQIESKVSQTDFDDAEGRISSAESTITQQAEQIALRVVKGDVATQLAVEADNVSVSGGNLIVDGYATVGALSTTNAKVDTLNNYLNGTTQISRALIARADISSAYASTLYVKDSSDVFREATWKSKYVLTSRGTITLPTIHTTQRDVVYISGGMETHGNYYLITSKTDGSVGSASGDTIYYLGR